MTPFEFTKDDTFNIRDFKLTGSRSQNFNDFLLPNCYEQLPNLPEYYVSDNSDMNEGSHMIKKVGSPIEK